MDIKTKYNIGDTLYYIYQGNIRSITINGISIKCKKGPYYNPEILEISYHLESDITTDNCLESNISRNYYESKADIIKHFADQLQQWIAWNG